MIINPFVYLVQGGSPGGSPGGGSPGGGSPDAPGSPSGGGGGSTIWYNDTFTDADGTNINAHTAESGTTYTVAFGSGSIQSNSLDSGTGSEFRSSAITTTSGITVLEANYQFRLTGNGNFFVELYDSTFYQYFGLNVSRVSGAVRAQIYGYYDDTPFPSFTSTLVSGLADTFKLTAYLAANKQDWAMYIDDVLQDSGTLSSALPLEFNRIRFSPDNANRIRVVDAQGRDYL